MKIVNRAAGPRVFNVREGEVIRQRTLLPGEAADLEIADAEGPAFKAMMEAGEVEEGEGDPPAPLSLTSRPDDEAGPEAVVRTSLDQERNTPPYQLSGDGGVDQLPTVDGTPGLPTPDQGEGTGEQKAFGKAAEAEARNAAGQQAQQKAQRASEPKRGR